MGFAFLLLGLFPVMFLADMFTDQDSGDDDEASADEPADTANINEDGDFIAEPDDADISTVFNAASGDDPLQPIVGDEEPFAGSEIDPDEVLQPFDEDVEPEPGSDVDPDDVLSPIDEPGEDYSGGGTGVQELLNSETGLNTGIEMLGLRVGIPMITNSPTATMSSWPMTMGLPAPAAASCRIGTARRSCRTARP